MHHCPLSDGTSISLGPYPNYIHVSGPVAGDSSNKYCSNTNCFLIVGLHKLKETFLWQEQLESRVSGLKGLCFHSGVCLVGGWHLLLNGMTDVVIKQLDLYLFEK